VTDPVDRDDDGDDGEPPEPQSVTSRAVEIEVGPEQEATPEYLVHAGGTGLSADRVRVGGVRIMLPADGSTVLESSDGEKLQTRWHVEQVNERAETPVVDITRRDQ